MNICEVEFQGHVYRVPAVKVQGRLWFHWRGETHVVDTNKAARRSGGERANLKPGVIVAPMPGKITRVAVKVAENVHKGQTLIVMEAMKMEYTLSADRDGKVHEVKTVVGDQVTLGQTLLRLGD